MGKLRRDIGNNAQALAQWVGRKLVNHLPVTHNQATSPVKDVADDVSIDIDNPCRVIFTDQAGVTFSIIVSEIGPEERTRYRRGMVGGNAPGKFDLYLKETA